MNGCPPECHLIHSLTKREKKREKNDVYAVV